MCETSKPTLRHGRFCFCFNFVFIQNHSLLTLSPTYALLLLLPFLRQPNPHSPLPSAYCTVCLRGHPSLSVCPFPSVCLPVCCLAAWVCFVLPRVLSLVPVFPVLSICLSLSQLFHMVHLFLFYFYICTTLPLSLWPSLHPNKHFGIE